MPLELPGGSAVQGVEGLKRGVQGIVAGTVQKLEAVQEQVVSLTVRTKHTEFGEIN